MGWETIERAREKLSGEVGTVFKDWGGRLPIALIYPNSYYVGMSNLGVHVLYRLFNDYPNVVCERVFYERAASAPVSLESQRPLGDFAVLACSLSYELDYVNFVNMLRRSAIPLSSAERDVSHPLLIAGGPCVMANPEPLATIVDAFAIGEAEVIIPRLVPVLSGAVDSDRRELLRRLAELPGIYVPSFYQAEATDGQIGAIAPTAGVPYPVRRQWLADLDAYPASSVVLTRDTEFGDMYLLEVTRGCGRGCHFCLAGVAYSPVRERSLGNLLSTAREGLAHRHTIGLIGASLSDYSQIGPLTSGLREMGAKLSVSSLRVDPLSEVLLEALRESGSQTITLAPEAGSMRLRRKIRKGISTDDILRAVHLVAGQDFPHLKLYFMLGLPGEEKSDVEAIVQLMESVRKLFRRRITVNITPFVPKAQTPFERQPMTDRDTLADRINYVNKKLRALDVATRADSPRWAEVQAVLARGDRQLGEVLMTLAGTTLASWRRALKAAGLDASRYLGDRSAERTLPWSIIAPQACMPTPDLELAGQGQP
ncbi:MAG: B12-binding domain-containing radical SAM protein [Anaerolineae bacterium]|nr:B12-binding domain-containing radical SAM protein [Anaerolineae bacterium]